MKSRRSPQHVTRKLTLFALSLILAATSLSARSQETPSPVVTLRSVEAQPGPAGGTRVTFHGTQPLGYSLSSIQAGSWTMTMDGVDGRQAATTMTPGTPEVGRIVVRTANGSQGRPATRVEFEGTGSIERRVSLDGNDLMVDLTVRADAAQETTTPATPKEETPKTAPAAPAPAPATAPAAPPVMARATVMPTHATLSLNAAPAVRSEEGETERELVVSSGKSLTVDLESPVTRVSVANPAIADAVVVSPQQILINGLTHGTTSLVLWFRGGASRTYNLTVQMDTEALSRRLKEFFPDEQIAVGASKDTIVLYGTVSKPEIGDKAVKLATDYTGKVVNNMSYPPDGRRQIMLKIMFAEISKQALTDLSASLVRFDPLNPRGDHEGMTNLGTPASSGNFANTPVGPNFNFNDAINVYGFSFRDKWSVFINALKTRGLAQVLAEPTLITADGQKASFLAGGEIPVPVAQAGAGFTSVTVEWKKFGISLDFTPTVRDKDTIVMRVTPEVSSLDFGNAVVLSGFAIPALKTRRADTEIELKEGQSFAIAGLYSQDLAQTKKKIPLIGDIPGLGYLFRSKNLEKNRSELLVVATPTFVRPSLPGQAPQPPQWDESFELDKPKKTSKLETPKPVDESATQTPVASK